ncbi:MAG TPA: hypothetical protein VH350_08440 [Candidatus Sulfotelmatobacter sp.]|jgi:hypothetical protein|nr:hypothetical protein [Candidatus Sulfotelmatobacter sp.]
MGESNPLPPNPAYSVCGLILRSERRIPGLISAESSHADVEIRFQDHPDSLYFHERQIERYVSKQLTSNGEPLVRLWEIASRAPLYHLVYGDGTRFVIDQAGSQLWAAWTAETTFDNTLIYLLGPVLGFVLRLRGISCLHASAIAIDGFAIALAGVAGAGKSTAAAQFASMDYPILSDDIVMLQESESGFCVPPAPVRLRLWPPSVEHFYGYADALPRLTSSWEKRYLDLRDVGQQFESAPLPLAAVYLLNDPQTTAEDIEEVAPSAAMMQLLANVYVNYLLDDRYRETDFVRISKLVNTVTIRQVNLRHDFTALERICHSLVADSRRIVNSGQPRTVRTAPTSLVSCLR